MKSNLSDFLALAARNLNDGAAVELSVEVNREYRPSQKNAKPRYFGSYARTTHKVVEMFVRMLSIAAEVFLDTNIPGGTIWRNVIYEELKVADAVLVFWSEAAAKSEWVEWEWKMAIELKKPIYPLLLDETPLPAELAEFQSVDLILED